MLRLSQRQYDVLALLTTGKSAKECAKELNLSPRTIESHKYRLLDLLELDSHAELVQFALRNGVEY
nr:LuxR C-terminal-related transcriptional regulator [Vibrio rotiferianus]